MTTSSKVAIVFSRDHGKLRLAAKGARRPRSRFGASLEPITHGSYVIYRHERRELQTVSEGDIQYPFTELKADYRRMVCASAICDLLDHMTADEDPARPLYQSALDSLHWLERIDPGAVEVPVWYFQLQGAGFLGYRPHLDSCTTCGRTSDSTRMRFSPAAGGSVCSSCGSGGVMLDARTLQFLSQLQAGPRYAVPLQDLGQVDRRTARLALRTYLEYHLENRGTVRALNFMEQMLSADSGIQKPTGRSSEVDSTSLSTSRAAERPVHPYSPDAGLEAPLADDRTPPAVEAPPTEGFL